MHASDTHLRVHVGVDAQQHLDLLAHLLGGGGNVLWVKGVKAVGRQIVG